MATILELRQNLQDVQNDLKNAVIKGGELANTKTTQLEDMQKQAAVIEDLQIREALLKQDLDRMENEGKPAQPKAAKKASGFKSFGEFAQAVRNASVPGSYARDERLVSFKDAATGQNETMFDAKGWLIGGFFNPMSLVIIAIYVVSVIVTPKTEEKEHDEEIDNKLTVKQIWIRFTVASLVLIAASISVTLVTEQVVNGFNIGHTFGGSLFLGVATSLPEVTATVALCKKKNFDAAYGDIIGSCTFNIIILAIADIFSFRAPRGIFYITPEAVMLIIGTSFALIVLFLSILFIKSKLFKNDVKSRVILYSFGTLMVSSYIIYLLLASLKVFGA